MLNSRCVVSGNWDGLRFSFTSTLCRWIMEQVLLFQVFCVRLCLLQATKDLSNSVAVVCASRDDPSNGESRHGISEQGVEIRQCLPERTTLSARR